MVQRAVEQRGIPTVSPSVARDVTEHAKPPRALFLPFMMGHHFGVPFHTELQKQIIKRLLNVVETATESGEIQVGDFNWAEARREGKQLEKELSSTK